MGTRGEGVGEGAGDFFNVFFLFFLQNKVAYGNPGFFVLISTNRVKIKLQTENLLPRFLKCSGKFLL